MLLYTNPHGIISQRKRYVHRHNLQFLYHVLGDAGGLCKTASNLLVPVTASLYILKIYRILNGKIILAFPYTGV